MWPDLPPNSAMPAPRRRLHGLSFFVFFVQLVTVVSLLVQFIVLLSFPVEVPCIPLCSSWSCGKSPLFFLFFSWIFAPLASPLACSGA